MASIRGGRVASIKNLERSLKKSSGSGSIKYIPKDGGIVVRFLTEPEEWIEFFEHYEDGKGSYPCTDDTCDGCATGVRAAKRFLAAAVDVNDGRNAIALQVPTSAAKDLKRKYDRYNTLTDRDYEISRDGSGLDTEYSVDAEAPTKFNMRGIEPPDLMAILEDLAGLGEEEEEEERPRRPVKKSSTRRREYDDTKGAPSVVKKKRRPTILDEDDDDEEYDGRHPTRISRPVRKTVPVKKTIVKKVNRRR